MDMPVTERRLNLRFINEHLEKLQEIRKEQQTVTADKPLVSKPNIKPKEESPTYTSKVKKR
jgi:hypothetical protein